ncbi:MAG: Gfo/Idh/MocA family oxidoreductase [Planctomycetes bacterium]|nr:Gfo/Idh/MocA family oxidoreductase [Planctomycetota bacterium]
MIRFGLVGCGTHARWAVVPALGSTPDRFTLAAVCDISRDNLAAVGAQGVAQFTDHREMLAKAEIDAVYVATLADTHAAIAIEAMKAGKHVICEKPMATSVEDCRAMVETAEKNKRILAVNFETRYEAEVRAVRRWIDEGRLGRIEAVHVQHFWDGHKAFGALAARRFRLSDLAGGLDCGIHKADQIRHFCGGRWADISARGRWFGESTKHPPHISVTAELDNGVLATLSASFAYGAYMQPVATSDVLTIVGSAGVVNCFNDTIRTTTLRLHSQSLVEAIDLTGVSHVHPMTELVRDFADAVEGRGVTQRMATGVDGWQAQVFVEQANRDANAHRLTGALR